MEQKSYKNNNIASSPHILTTLKDRRLQCQHHIEQSRYSGMRDCLLLLHPPNHTLMHSASFKDSSDQAHKIHLDHNFQFSNEAK